MLYSMSIRSRAAKTNSGAGALWPDEHASLQVLRRIEAREREHGGRQVDEAHELIADGAGRERRRQCLRPADHQRHAQTRVVERALRTRHAVAVIAPVEDDRVLGQPIGLELFEELADLGVHVGDVVVHARQLFAHQRRVRVVRRHRDLRRIGDERLALARRARRKDLALVRHRQVEHREERLGRIATITPVRVVAEIVPDRERVTPNW